MQDDAVAVEQRHADKRATISLQGQHLTLFLVPYNCDTLQVEHNGVAIRKHYTAIANERESKGSHSIAWESQETIEACINYRFNFFPSLVRTYDHKANHGLLIGGHYAHNHRCGTVKRPPSRYAAGYPMRSPYSIAPGRLASTRFVAVRSSSSTS